jgi:hypothetical protein
MGRKLDNKHWYVHIPISVETSLEGKVRNVEPTMQTDITIANNKPDIIMHNNDKGTCVLIDVAIYGDRNVIKSEAEKTKI